MFSAYTRIFQRNAGMNYVRIGDKGDKTPQFLETKDFSGFNVFIAKNRVGLGKMV